MSERIVLPKALPRRARGGPDVCSISVDIEVVTPILGGGSATRTLDEVDKIRVATVRGHLRFWWRALRAHEFNSPTELFNAEGTLWGRAATDEGGRSAVDIRVDVHKVGNVDESDIELQKTPGAYALWVARADKKKNVLPAPRREPGTRFNLTLIAPAKREPELRNVVRAWILFGGYGSRTRRGLGSLRVADGGAAKWHPSSVSRDSLDAIFGRNVLAISEGKLDVTPWLAGAALRVGQNQPDAITAWTTALGWLQEFRQGVGDPQGQRAREPGEGKLQPQRPSISNWPEADKIRQLSHKTQAHPPRHNATPAWPRAGFGLPIVGRFQTKARNGDFFDEPGPFEFRWRSKAAEEWEEHGRLASPLIVKALPLADGSYVACALWLTRGFPPGAEARLTRQRKEFDSQSAAPFDRLVAPGDTARFAALADKDGLRRAFFDWLDARNATTVIAP